MLFINPAFMKKRFFLYIFFTFFFKISVAQQYYSFPTSNAMWRENSGGFQCSCCADYQYVLTGDTIIDGTTYHKIQNSGVTYLEDNIGNCTSNIQNYFNFYRGALREDIGNKKIYLRQPGSSIDTLVYDFNLNLGDTLPPLLINQTTSYNWVSKIDSILIGGVFHKQYLISSDTTIAGQLDYVALIEGVGGTFGLFASLIPPFEAGSNLNCFAVNNTTLYPNNGSICSPIILSADAVGDLFQMEIYPNPVNDIVNFFYTGNTSPIIEIRNLLGDIVDRIKINPNQIYNYSTQSLKNSVYLIQVFEKEKLIVTKKLIIAK